MSTASVADLSEYQKHSLKSISVPFSYLSDSYYEQVGLQFKSLEDNDDLVTLTGARTPAPDLDDLPLPTEFNAYLDLLSKDDDRHFPKLATPEVTKVGAHLKKRTDRKINALAPPPCRKTGSTSNDRLGPNNQAPPMESDDNLGAVHDPRAKCAECSEPISNGTASCSSCTSSRPEDSGKGSSS